jgi:hypothetical protein
MVGWLLLAALCMIWVAFLLPSRRGDGSPAATVGEFERNMSMLAETNTRSPSRSSGRWVVMPQKGQRLLGSKERNRIRVRQRRRVVFTTLVEGVVITGLIGLVPFLRPVLYLTAGLGVALLLYSAMLLKVRSDEARLARSRRIRMVRRRMAQERTAAPAYAGNGYAYREAYDLDVASRSGRTAGVDEYGRRRGSVPAPRARVSAPRGRVDASNGNGNDGSRNGSSNGHAGKGSPRNGSAEAVDYVVDDDDRIEFVDDDVHVTVWRTSDLETEARRAATR